MVLPVKINQIGPSYYSGNLLYFRVPQWAANLGKWWDLYAQ